MIAARAILFLSMLNFGFGLAPVYDPPPGPTPTLYPVLDAITDTSLITLSLQIQQAAEFGLFSYYDQDIADPDPVVVTDTLPSGNVFSVRREFSYGELVVGLVGIALLLFLVFRFVWEVSTQPKEG